MASAWKSIRYRLPLLTGALLLGVAVVLAGAAYVDARRVALHSASDRLEHVTVQLSELLGISTRHLLAEAREIARDSTIQAYLQRPIAASTDATRSLLVTRTRASSLLAAELRAPDGRLLLSTRPDQSASDTAVRAHVAPLVRAPDSALIGPIVNVQGEPAYGVIAKVTNRDRLLGHVVQWFRLTLAGSPEGQRRLTSLIGSEARLYLGTVGGEVWTDFIGSPQAPPLKPATGPGVVVYDRPRHGRQIAAARAVPNTPWTLVIEFPYTLVMARPEAMLERMTLFVAIVLAAAAFAAWALAGRLTGPLADLAAAAQGISDGQYGRRVAIRRADELGVVGAAFNDMAAKVAQSRDQLEGKVRELEAAEERLRAVVASSGAVIYKMTIERETPTVGWVSDNVTRILGYERSETLAPGWWLETVHPDDRQRVTQCWVDSSPDEMTCEYRFLCGDGTYRWLRDTQRIVGRDDAGHLELTGALLDITDHRRLEEQVRQGQKLEAVGRLAGGVAHDFNNLLTVILTECDISLGELGEDAPARSSLQEIRDAAVRAALLTRQLLTFSRKHLVEPTTFSLNDIVADTSKMLRRLVPENVKLSYSITPDPGFVAADRGQVEQVLVNLVVNARDAMPEGGSTFIETANVTLDASYASTHAGVTAGAYTMLAVSDTGVGMPSEVQAHLFEPFFTTKGPGKGTGLGLATCYAIVKEFGGHIGVYSEVGKGTTMKVYLPRLADAPIATGTSLPAPILGGRETILLVEDEDKVRASAVRILTGRGYNTLEARDGEEALDILRRYTDPVDLMVTDVVLPKMSGRVLAERVIAMRPSIRTLYTSGYTEDVILQHELLGQGIVLLQKPFTVESLARKVREVLDNPPVPRPTAHNGSTA